MEVFECDLVDVQALRKYNDSYKYLLTVIDVHLKSITGKDISSALQTVLQDRKYLKPIKRRPIWLVLTTGKNV